MSRNLARGKYYALAKAKVLNFGANSMNFTVEKYQFFRTSAGDQMGSALISAFRHENSAVQNIGRFFVIRSYRICRIICGFPLENPKS
jgi:hypothetical protein